MTSQSAAEALESMDAQERRALETVLVTIADDEFTIAERYTEWQVRAPTLESDLALSNIAQDELGHARLWYDVLDDLGYDETDLLYERDPEDFRHATLCELPFEDGDWADAILRSYLYDVAEGLRLDALGDSSYPKIANRVPKIREEEAYHLDHAETWLERLAESPDGRSSLQAALDRLFPHALTLFEPATPPQLGTHEDTIDGPTMESIIVETRLRPVSLVDLGQEWIDIVTATLEGLGLSIPHDDRDITRASLPAETGRSGDHTSAWFDLYDDFTHTYRELERTHTTRIMPRPDDE